MAKYVNIGMLKHQEQTLQRIFKASSGYTESTGKQERVKYTGTWDELVAYFEDYDGGGKSAGEQITLTLDRVGGLMGELVIQRDYFERPGDAGGGDEEEPGTPDSTETPGTEDFPSYSSGGTLVPVSILCHPKFASIGEMELRALKAMLDGQDENALLADDDSNATAGKRIKDMIKSDAGKKAMEYIRKGVKEWPETHTQVTARWKGRGNKYTLRSIVASVPGSVSTPAGCNWRVDGVGTDEQGGVVWQTATFTLSGAGGWDKYLYES